MAMKRIVCSLVCGAALTLNPTMNPVSGQSPAHTATVTAVLSQTPSPIPPPRIVIDQVQALIRHTVGIVATQVKNGRTVRTKHIGYIFKPVRRFHYAAVPRFVATYHTRNAGSYLPTAVLRITTAKGASIFRVHMLAAPDGKQAFQSDIHPQAEQYVGPLVARFTLRLGPAQATRSLAFFVDRNGPPCTNSLYHCPTLTLGRNCRYHLSLSENSGRPTFAICRLAGHGWYAREGVVIRYSLSLSFIPRRADQTQRVPGVTPPGVVCLSKRTNCRHVKTDEHGGFAPFWVRLTYLPGDIDQGFEITAYGAQTDRASMILPYTRVVS
jgi:hypothetical protein